MINICAKALVCNFSLDGSNDEVVYIDDIEHETYVDQGNYLAEYAITFLENIIPCVRTVIFCK